MSKCDDTELSTPGPSDGNAPALVTAIGTSSDNPLLENSLPKSEVLTLEPFAPSQSRIKKTKYRHDPTLTHFDSLFGSGSWSRFLILESESKITALKLENFLLTRHSTTEMSFRQMKEGTWLIEATTKNQSEDYMSITKIGNTSVKVKKHDTMNSIQGTVVLPERDDEPIEKSILLDSQKKIYKRPRL